MQDEYYEENTQLIYLRTFVHTYLPQAGFKLGALGQQAGVLPNEPPLLVSMLQLIGVFSHNMLLNSIKWVNITTVLGSL